MLDDSPDVDVGQHDDDRGRRPPSAATTALAKYHQCGCRSRTSSSPSRSMKSGVGHGRRWLVVSRAGCVRVSRVDADAAARRPERRRSAQAVTSDRPRRCASWPGPARARPGCSPAASPTGSPTGDADPRHVLALTFTRKAAGELRARLRPARACATRSPPAPSTPSPTPSSAGAGPTAASRPPDAARPQGRLRRPPAAGRRGRAPCSRSTSRPRSSGPRPARVDARRLRGRGHAGRAPAAARRRRDRRPSSPATRTRSGAGGMVDFDDLLRLCRRDLLDDRDVRRRPSAGGSGTSSSTSSRTSTRSSTACSSAWRGRPRRPVRGRRPQPGHLRLERRRPAVPRRLRPTATPAADGRRASTTTTARARRSWPWPTRVLAGGAGVAGRRCRRATGPTARCPTVRAFATDDAAEARAIARAVRDHHRPGRAAGRPRPCCAAPTPRSSLIERGAARGRHPVPGAGRRRPARPARGPGRPSRDLRRRRGRFGAAVADLDAPSWPRPTRRRRDHGRPTTGRRPRSTSRAANLAALVRLARDYLAIDPAGRPPTGSSPGCDHRRSATDPTATATRSSSPPSTRPRASSGRSCTSPASSRAWCRSATPRPTRPQAEERRLLLRGRHPGRAGAALHLGRARAPSASATSPASRSPYLDEVEAAVPGARAPATVPADWATYLPAQRATPARPHAARRPRPSGRPARRRGGDGPVGHDRSRTPAASDLDPVGLATFDALKAWRTRQARAAVGAAPRHLPRPGAARGGRHPTAHERRPAGRPRHRRGQGRAVRRRDPRHRRRRTGHPEPMRFRAEQRFTTPVDRLLALFTDPDFYPTLDGPAPISAPEVVEPLDVGRHRRASACASATPATCRRPRWPFIDPAKLTLGRGARLRPRPPARPTTRLLPDHYPDRLTCQGVYVFPTRRPRQHPPPRRRAEGAGAAGRRPGREGARRRACRSTPRPSSSSSRAA